MNYETIKAKAERNKEVRDEGKQREREQLANYLTCKWQYADNTSYNKQFRQYKLLEMIQEITFYIEIVEGGNCFLLKHEHYMLLSLIRGITDVIDGKTTASKRVFEKRLQDFIALSESGA